MNHRGEIFFDVSEAERALRSPRHRWETAQKLPPCRFDRLVQQSEDVVRAAHHFQQMARRGDTGFDRARAMYPEVAAAVALEGDTEKLEDLKVAVLGGLSPAETARRLEMDEEVVKTWVALFYDIDVKNCRNAVGWIATHIVEPELSAGRSDLAAKLKLVASVGSVGARAVLDVGSRAPVTVGEHLFQRRLQLHLKYERALAMTEGPEYHFRFVRLSLNLKTQENRLRIAEAKLGGRCSAALRKHELAQIRLETELERAKCRSAREARKAEEATLVKDGEQYARELVAARLQRFELAEQKEAVARAAASPLARLTWNRPQQSQVSLLSRVKPTPDTRINVSAEINTSLTFWQGSDLAVHGQTAAVTV